VRRQHQQLVALGQQALQREIQPVRATVHHHHVVDMRLDAVLARQLGHQRLAQRALAARVGVVRVAVARGTRQRFDDVRRRVEVGLATLQVHYALAGLLAGACRRHDTPQLGRAAKHRAIGDQSWHAAHGSGSGGRTHLSARTRASRVAACTPQRCTRHACCHAERGTGS